MVLTVKDLRQSYWLVDSIADIYVCNNRRLMTNYIKKPTRVGESTVDRVLLGREKVKIRLTNKDSLEDLVLTLTNVFYPSNSSSNLVSFCLLNDARIYHHNEDQTLYYQSTWKKPAFAKRYKTSFFLHPLNLSSIAMNLLTRNKVYKEPKVNQMQNKKQFLILWYQKLGHLNFTTLKKYLMHHHIKFISNAKGFICDSCKRI